MSLVAVGSPKASYTTFEIVRNGLWAFAKGFADSLRGAVDLFLLDYRRVFFFIHSRSVTLWRFRFILFLTLTYNNTDICIHDHALIYSKEFFILKNKFVI